MWRSCTRFGDVDVYGIVYNVIYYSYGDNAIQTFYVERAGMAPTDALTGSLVVTSSCRYIRSLGFPASIRVGLRVTNITNSSVTYECGVFEAIAANTAPALTANTTAAEEETHLCALLTFVHVFVTKSNMRPTPIPAKIRQALTTLLITEQTLDTTASTAAVTPAATAAVASAPAPLAAAVSSSAHAPLQQCASRVLMVSPLHFRRNDETASDNAFMHASSLSARSIQARAQAEFDAYVQLLRSRGIQVQIEQPAPDLFCPDGVYPNNWFSTHAAEPSATAAAAGVKGGRQGSLLIIYPMRHVSRRLERSPRLIAALSARYDRVLDFSSEELLLSGGQAGGRGAAILEGTGAAIFDHVNHTLYHALSERSHAALANKLAQALWPSSASASASASSSSSPSSASPSAPPPTVFSFSAVDSSGRPYYHTNVLMGLGTHWAVLCVEALVDPAQAAEILAHLARTGHEVIRITRRQVECFCGNVLELRNQRGQRFVVMSSAAHAAFTPEQRSILTKRGGEILHTPLATIESIGGGGARCMVAELF